MQIMSYKLEASLPFEQDDIEKFLLMCEEVITNMTSDEKAYFKLKSAAHELVINSLEHGYKRSFGKVSFSIEKNIDSIILEIADEGTGFDFDLLNGDFNFTDINSIKARGWGLMIIKKLFDKMDVMENNPRGIKIRLTLKI